MGKTKILCVDDEVANLELFRELLQDEFEVLTALSGEEALAIFRKVEGIAIVISDQRMPGMTGVELLSRILELDSDTIRIIVTGYPGLTDIIEAVNLGNIYKYFTKPFAADDLRASLQRARKHYELTREKKRLIATLEKQNRLLERKNKELKEANATLQGVIKHNQHIREEMEANISINIKAVLAPTLERLKSFCPTEAQKDCLSLLEKNIEAIASSLPRKLSCCRFPLTPTEMQIVNCIIHGKNTKQITSTLNLSIRTVETHRYNIRKKLGLQHKTVDLRSHLLSL